MANIENRQNEFFILTIILLIIGVLQYFRKIVNGYKLDKLKKFLYITTLIVFSVSTMCVLYFSSLSNVLSFFIGLVVATSSEQIAKLFLIIGNNFNNIGIKIIKNYSGIDLKKELDDQTKK